MANIVDTELYSFPLVYIISSDTIVRTIWLNQNT